MVNGKEKGMEKRRYIFLEEEIYGFGESRFKMATYFMVC